MEEVSVINVKLSQEQMDDVFHGFYNDSRALMAKVPDELSLPYDIITRIGDNVSNIKATLDKLTLDLTKMIDQMNTDNDTKSKNKNLRKFSKPTKEMSVNSFEKTLPTEETEISKYCFQKLDRNIREIATQEKDHFVYMWKLENFSHLKKDAKNGKNDIIFSEPFSRKGLYQMTLLICPNGIGEARNEFLSIYFQIIEGPEDEILEWPCRFNLKFTLINQVDERKNYYYILPPAKSIIHTPAAQGSTFSRGEKKFFPLANLKPNYLVNDCIYVKMDVVFYSLLKFK